VDTKFLIGSGLLCDKDMMVTFVLWDTSMLYTCKILPSWRFIQGFLLCGAT